MTKEGSTYQNAIRFRNGTNDNSAKAKKIFQSQKPGIYAQDALHTYRCSEYKTKRGEPVWNRMEPAEYGGPKPSAACFILVDTGDSGTKPKSRTLGGKEISYTLPAISQRLRAGRLYEKNAFGQYIFIYISSTDEVIPVSETTASTGTTQTVNTADQDLIKNILDAEKNFIETYRYLNRDTNGRSTPNENAGSKSTPAQLNSPTSSTYVVSGKPLTAPKKKGKKTPSSGKTGGGSGTGQPTPNSPSLSTVVVKLKPDKTIYNGDNSYNGYADKPYMQQTITVFGSELDENDKEQPTKQRIVRRHIFEIIPNSFEFSQLSSTWNEIERSGNYPMVDWSKYNLTKCSFRFLVSGRRTDSTTVGQTVKNTVVNDGMEVSVDKQIENIRIMAGSPSPVILYNLNALLSTSYRFPYLDNTRGIQWVIADLSVTATRLTPNGRAIAAAEVSITLNEYPIIGRDIVDLPPLVPDLPVPEQCKPKPCKPARPPRDPLWLRHYSVAVGDALATPEAK